MESPGEADLRQGVLRKELTWQFGGMAGRPACLRRVSRGREGAGFQAVGSRPGSGMKAIGWSTAEEGGGLMWDLKDSFHVCWRSNSRRNLKS